MNAIVRPSLTAHRTLLPGLALAGGVTAIAFGLRYVPGVAVFSPMILAIVAGIVVANVVRIPASFAPGLAFAMRTVLRAAIVLLGLRITPGQLAALGLPGFAVVAATLVTTFAFTGWLGRRMGLRPQIADLIAAGTSICGASAVVAMNGVSNGSREDVAHAVAAVTVFGTLSMFLFPALQPLLAMEPRAYGLWTGASIHEIAQVIAAGFQHGTAAGEFATVAKLARVALMAPVIVAIGLWRGRGQAPGERPAFPWFVVGFLAMVALGGVIPPAPALLDAASLVTTLLFTFALGAMGLMVDIRRLASEGWRPMALGAAAWIFVSIFALACVEAAGHLGAAAS